MTTAFVFPGQGSQSIGMMQKMAEAFPLVQTIFADASTALNIDLWDIVTNGPEEKIRDELRDGTLKRLSMEEGEERFADLYLVYAEADYAGPAARRLGEILKKACAELCGAS